MKAVLKRPRPTAPLRWQYLYCLALTIIMNACMTYPPADRPAAPVPLPEAFALYGPAAPSPDRWWESFRSEELNRLVDEALAGNFTLEQAAARLRTTAAEARRLRAGLRPNLDFGADAAVSRSQRDNTQTQSPLDRANQRVSALETLIAPPGTGVLQTSENRLRALESLLGGAPPSDVTSSAESYGTGLAASYEVDLWGRIRADIATAQFEYEASREDLHAAMQSVAAQMVLTWLDLLEARQELELVQSQIESNRVTLELVELRRSKGLATALDVFQQRQAVAGREAIVPVLELRIESFHYQIALLLGKTPQDGPRILTETFAPLGPLPETGLPADLLARRPDIRAAGLRLQAADWAVAAARADRLPSLRLSASVDLSGNAVDDVFDDWFARLAASLTGPIFDGGRRKAAVARARAVADERLAAYRRVVVTAVYEVSDSLLREAKQRELIEALQVQYDAAKQTHEEAMARYRKGLNDYLPVLNALTNMQNLERELVQEERTLRFERVQLALALGGSWMDAARRSIEEPDEQ